MKVIWINGVFDVLHVGHLNMLEHARSIGDKLIVGIDSDQKVKIDKGEGRPFNVQEDRKKILEGIRYVDEVIIFSSKEELENCIKKINPDVMVIGSDWMGKKIVGSEYAKEVKFFERIPGYSTTAILNYEK